MSVSASQINDAVGCLRKWAWPRLNGIPKSQHRTALVGEKIHGVLEAWLLKGAPPNTDWKLTIDGVDYFPGRTALNGMHHLPPPGPHLSVERAFNFRHWTGRIDFAWVALDGRYLMPEEIERARDSIVIPGIGDHKSTGAKNFQYALTEDTLRADPQGVIYANAVFEEFPNAREVDELWIYYGTRAPFPSKKVHLRVHRDESRYRLEPMDRLAEALLRLRQSNLKAEDLPPSIDACDSYGGCPYRTMCPLTPEQLMRGYMNNTSDMSLEEKMAMATQAANGAMATHVQVPPPVGGEWVVHENPAFEWNTTTREVRPRQAPPPPVVAAPPVVTMPPIPAQPQVVAYVQPTQPQPPQQPYVATNGYAPGMLQPAIGVPDASAPQLLGYVPPGPGTAVPMQMPPLVQPAQYPIAPQPVAPPLVAPGAPAGLPPVVLLGPDGQPFGTINAPEGRGVPDKVQPVATAATTDDLDAMDKTQLQHLAASMGLETKRLKEPGLRDRIRSARTQGVVPGQAPPPAVNGVPFAAIGSSANGAGPIVGSMPSGAPVRASIGAELFETSTEDRVLQIVCAVIRSGANLGDMKAVVAWARTVVNEIESA